MWPYIIIILIISAVAIRALQRYELKKFKRTATTLDRCIYADRLYLIVKATKDEVAIEIGQNFPIWVSRADIKPSYSTDRHD